MRGARVPSQKDVRLAAGARRGPERGRALAPLAAEAADAAEGVDEYLLAEDASLAAQTGDRQRNQAEFRFLLRPQRSKLTADCGQYRRGCI